MRRLWAFIMDPRVRYGDRVLDLGVIVAITWLLSAIGIYGVMAYSVAHETFAASPVFADGKTLQAPPAGAIARGRLPLRFSGTAAEAERAGRELHNPLDSTDAAATKAPREFCVA